MTKWVLKPPFLSGAKKKKIVRTCNTSILREDISGGDPFTEMTNFLYQWTDILRNTEDRYRNRAQYGYVINIDGIYEPAIVTTVAEKIVKFFTHVFRCHGYSIQDYKTCNLRDISHNTFLVISVHTFDDLCRAQKFSRYILQRLLGYKNIKFLFIAFSQIPEVERAIPSWLYLVNPYDIPVLGIRDESKFLEYTKGKMFSLPNTREKDQIVGKPLQYQDLEKHGKYLMEIQSWLQTTIRRLKHLLQTKDSWNVDYRQRIAKMLKRQREIVGRFRTVLRKNVDHLR